jgi:hypothetical protein
VANFRLSALVISLLDVLAQWYHPFDEDKARKIELKGRASRLQRKSLAMNVKQLLVQLDRATKLDSSVLKALADKGYVKVSDVTNHQTPPGQKEYLFIDFTEEGRRVLRS